MHKEYHLLLTWRSIQNKRGIDAQHSSYFWFLGLDNRISITSSDEDGEKAFTARRSPKAEDRFCLLAASVDAVGAVFKPNRIALSANLC